MALKATKISNASSDNVRFIKGKYITAADGDGDYIVCELPRKSLITFTAVDIKTAYTGSSNGTLTVGVKEPATAIVADALGDDTVVLSEVTGVKRMLKSLYLENGGVVTLGVTKGNSAANAVARVFVGYTVIH